MILMELLRFYFFFFFPKQTIIPLMQYICFLH